MPNREIFASTMLASKFFRGYFLILSVNVSSQPPDSNLETNYFIRVLSVVEIDIKHSEKGNLPEALASFMYVSSFSDHFRGSKAVSF